MRMYFMRHASADSKSETGKRPLSEAGLREATSVADFVGRHSNIKVKVVLHSGKLRAHQTADIMAAKIKPKPRVMEANNLGPNDNTTVWIDRALTMEEDVLVVGHLPHLGRLTACLLNQDESLETVDFPPATLVCLLRGEAGKWMLDWKVTPQVLL